MLLLLAIQSYFLHAQSDFAFSGGSRPPVVNTRPGSVPAPRAPTPDSGSGNGVLYIGDSYNMNDGIGVAVSNYLKSSNPGQPFQRIAVCGSSPAHWVRGGHSSTCAGHNYDCDGALCSGPRTTRPIDQLMQSKPKLVVIGLGANQLNPAGQYNLSDARKMAQSVAASGSQCVWIGPPQVGLKVTSDASLTKFIRELEDAVKPCKFIHSETKATRNYFNGGLHPTSPGYKAWSEKVIADLQILRPTQQASLDTGTAAR